MTTPGPLTQTPVHTIHLMCTYAQVQVTNISPQRDNKEPIRMCPWLQEETNVESVSDVTDGPDEDSRALQAAAQTYVSLLFFQRLRHICVGAPTRTTFLPRGYSNQTHFSQADSLLTAAFNTFSSDSTLQVWPWSSLMSLSECCGLIGHSTGRTDMQLIAWKHSDSSSPVYSPENTSSLRWRVKLSLHTERVLSLIPDPLICCRALD